LNFNITIKKNCSVSREVPQPAGLTLEGLFVSTFAAGGCAMLPRLKFDQCCEIVGRASAIIAVAGMASLGFAATAVDVLRQSTGH